MKCCLKTEVWDSIQFNAVDGIDGIETIVLAKSLNLSRNGGSKIWEIKSMNGWKTVNSGDWILSSAKGFGGELVYTILSDTEFTSTMLILEKP